MIFEDLAGTYKRKRWRHRIQSGIDYAEMRKRPIYALVLTSSNKAKYRDLYRDIDVLKKRLRRRYPNIQYCTVRTDEGNGVAHITYSGANLYKPMVKKLWYEIHESYIVDVSRVQRKKGYCRYLLTHYLTSHNDNEKCSFSRLSYSKRWLPEGALIRWKQITAEAKKRFFYNPIQRQHYYKKKPVTYRDVYLYKKNLWDKFLLYSCYPQILLNKFGLKYEGMINATY